MLCEKLLCEILLCENLFTRFCLRDFVCEIFTGYPVFRTHGVLYKVYIFESENQLFFNPYKKIFRYPLGSSIVFIELFIISWFVFYKSRVQDKSASYASNCYMKRAYGVFDQMFNGNFAGEFTVGVASHVFEKPNQ